MSLFIKKTKKRFIFLAEIFSHQGTDHVEAIEKESDGLFSESTIYWKNRK